MEELGHGKNWLLAGIWAAPAVQPRSHRVQPAEMDRKTLATEQRHGLVERQADDVGIGADDLDQESSGDALRSIAPRLAAPFARGEIGLDVLVGEALETHPRFDVALPERLLRRDQAHGRVDAVIASGEQPQALR